MRKYEECLHIIGSNGHWSVGRFAKWAFGLMDADDAEKIYGHLHELHTEEMKSLKLAGQQISVIKNNYKKLSAVIINLIKDKETIKTYIRQMADNIILLMKMNLK